MFSTARTCVLVGTAGLLLAAPPAGVSAAQPDGRKPVDLILVVDVSTSMFDPGDTTKAANDKQGIRWDGVQFLIDTADPEDRVALILYRADAALVTRRLDPSGFVLLGSGPDSGRLKLKDMVRAFQAHERDPDHRKKGYPVGGKGKEQGFEFAGGGTGSLLALRAIDEWKLLAGGARQTWVMLFTDGMDMEPAEVEKRPRDDKKADDKIEWGRDRFEYVKPLLAEYEPEKKKTPPAPSDKVLAGLKQEIRAVIRPFQAEKVPVFTFGLYNPDPTRGTAPYELALMRQLLPEIARLSLEGVAADIRFARIPAGYEASSNLILLNKLQDVGWELRELWQIRETTGRDGGRGPFHFATPDRRLCDDLGVLLYREVAVDGVTVVRAPDTTAGDGEVLRSASHDYVRVQPQGRTGPVQVEALFPAGGDAHAVFGARLKAPLLRYTHPDPNRAYTPVDAIPIVVEFDAAGDTSLQPQLFEVRATVVRPGHGGAAKRIDLVLDPAADVKGGWAFRGELIPDEFRRPDSGATPGLMGLWSIDVEVKATQTGPLRGATRRLLRRQVNVGPYPVVRRPSVSPEVSNRGKAPARGTAEFTLDPRPIPSKDRVLASLAAELRPTEDPAWKALKLPPLDRIEVKDGVAAVPLDLSAGFDWAAVPKEGLRAKLVARAPWAAKDDPGAECEVVIRKDRYPVKVTGELTFDLSGTADKGGPAVEDKVRAALDTPLATEEPARVSGTGGAKPTDEVTVVSEVDPAGKLTLKLVAPDPVKVSGQGGGEIRVALERPATPPATGQYTGTVYLVPAGDARATEAVAVKVRVRVNQPIVKHAGAPVPRVRMVALAGTTTTRQIEIALRENIKDQTISRVEPPRLDASPTLDAASTDPADRLPVQAIRLADNRAATRFTLTAEVPRSVRDGFYATRVVFDVTAATKKADGGKPEEHAFRFPFPVEVEVRRYAVRAEVARGDGGKPLTVRDPDAPRRLVAKDPAADEASLPVDLYTEVKGAAVRWWAEVVPDGQPAGAGAPKVVAAPGKPPPSDEWFKDRVDVFELDGGKEPQSVVGKGARPLPVSEHVSEPTGRKLRVVARKLGALEPGLYRCTIRLWGELDPADPNASKGPAGEPIATHFDLPVEVLVRGRQMTTQLLDGGRLEVTVTSFGCPTGGGQVRSREDPKFRIPVAPVDPKPPAEGKAVEVIPPVPLAPTAGGLTRYVVYWPRRATTEAIPDAPMLSADDVREREVAVWRRPELVIHQRVAAAGDRVAVRLPLTPTTIGMLGGKPLTARAARRGATGEAPIEFQLSPDPAGGLAGSFVLPTGTPLPPAGEYEVTVPPLPAPDKLAADPKERTPAPVVVLLGLELRKADRGIGPVVYGGGFFSTDHSTEPSVLRVTNHTGHPVRYEVRILYPQNKFASQAITAQNLVELPLGSFDPSQHLDVKPLVGDGTLQPEQAADVGVDAGLSEDALDAYLNDREHPTLGAKNGAVLQVTVTGQGPDGREFMWEVRHPLVVETQSWRNRGLLYGLVGAVAAGGAGWYGYRWWRRWVARNRANAAAPPDGVFGNVDAPLRPPSPAPPEDDLPGPGNLFGGPPL